VCSHDASPVLRFDFGVDIFCSSLHHRLMTGLVAEVDILPELRTKLFPI